MRKFFRRYMPEPSSLAGNRLFALMGKTLLQPALWHLNRHTAASGVAVGMFCGLIPGPLQMLGAALVCIVVRANLPIALVTTFYTNPLTIVPLYVLAFGIGRFIFGSSASFVMPPEKGAQNLLEWAQALLHWLFGMGEPLAIGLLVLATALSVASYFVVKLLWVWHVRRAVKLRQLRRGQSTARPM